MTDKELMQQALDVIEAAIKAGDWKVDGACDPDYVLEALRARLAQPEPEPVAWMSQGGDVSRSRRYFEEMGFVDLIPLYTAPPQREWVGLTDKEHIQIAIDCGCLSADWVFYGAAIERKLKEKNA